MSTNIYHFGLLSAQVSIMLFSIIINFNRLGAAILFHMYKLNKFKVIPGETATEATVSAAAPINIAFHAQAIREDGVQAA